MSVKHSLKNGIARTRPHNVGQATASLILNLHKTQKRNSTIRATNQPYKEADKQLTAALRSSQRFQNVWQHSALPIALDTGPSITPRQPFSHGCQPPDFLGIMQLFAPESYTHPPRGAPKGCSHQQPRMCSSCGHLTNGSYPHESFFEYCWLHLMNYSYVISYPFTYHLYLVIENRSPEQHAQETRGPWTRTLFRPRRSSCKVCPGKVPNSFEGFDKNRQFHIGSAPC